MTTRASLLSQAAFHKARKKAVIDGQEQSPFVALFYLLPTSTCSAGAITVACAPRRPNRRIANQSNVPRFKTITGMVSSKVCTPTELGSGLVAPRMIKTTCFQEDHAACAWD